MTVITRAALAAVASLCLVTSAFAQQAPNTEGDNTRKDSQVTPPTTVPALPDERVGTMLGFSGGGTYTSHFISFGADVWGGGNNASPFSADSTAFLYGTLTCKFTPEFSGFINIWSDLNDNVDSEIGGPIQEIDFNAGVNYTWNNFTFGATWAYWQFGGGAEKAIELSAAYNDKDLWEDTLKGFALNPSVLFHYRYDTDGDLTSEIAGVLQFGIAPSYTFTFEGMADYPLSVAVPLNAGYFTDPYQGGDGAGFGYVNAGVSVGVPLAFIPKQYGAWTASVSEVFFHTFDEDIPGNPNENFFVTSLSLGVSF